MGMLLTVKVKVPLLLQPITRRLDLSDLRTKLVHLDRRRGRNGPRAA